MESFIVRIYRRAGDEAPSSQGEVTGEAGAGAVQTGPVGTVEATATGERTTFHSNQELLSALTSGPKPKAKAARASERAPKLPRGQK
jgi:hypothetical protein